MINVKMGGAHNPEDLKSNLVCSTNKVTFIILIKIKVFENKNPK